MFQVSRTLNPTDLEHYESLQATHYRTADVPTVLSVLLRQLTSLMFGDCCSWVLPLLLPWFLLLISSISLRITSPSSQSATTVSASRSPYTTHPFISSRFVVQIRCKTHISVKYNRGFNSAESSTCTHPIYAERQVSGLPDMLWGLSRRHGGGILKRGPPYYPPLANCDLYREICPACSPLVHTRYEFGWKQETTRLTLDAHQSYPNRVYETSVWRPHTGGG